MSPSLYSLSVPTVFAGGEWSELESGESRPAIELVVCEVWETVYRAEPQRTPGATGPTVPVAPTFVVAASSVFSSAAGNVNSGEASERLAEARLSAEPCA